MQLVIQHQTLPGQKMAVQQFCIKEKPTAFLTYRDRLLEITNVQLGMKLVNERMLQPQSLYTVSVQLCGSVAFFLNTLQSIQREVEFWYILYQYRHIHFVCVFLLIVPAAIVSSSSNTVETEASNVTIYCNATGNPTPNITWRRRGSSAVLHHGESYIIYNINRNQAGDYICSAWNKIEDKDNATVTITVQCKLTLILLPATSYLWGLQICWLPCQGETI